MSKKMKLTLNGLKVQSFVTSLPADVKRVIKGGATVEASNCPECDTPECPTGALTCGNSCGDTCYCLPSAATNCPAYCLQTDRYVTECC